MTPAADVLGVEGVERVEKILADRGFIHPGIDRVGVELHHRSAGPFGPVAALVLEEVVKRDVVEAPDTGGPGKGPPSRFGRSVEPQPPDDKGIRQGEALHRAPETGVVEIGRLGDHGLESGHGQREDDVVGFDHLAVEIDLPLSFGALGDPRHGAAGPHVHPEAELR